MPTPEGLARVNIDKQLEASGWIIQSRHDLASHLHSVTLSDDQMVAIEAFCARMGKGLDKGDFNTRRQIVELLDVRGKVALENGEKRLYLKCLINSPEQQPHLPMQISPSSMAIGKIPLN